MTPTGDTFGTQAQRRGLAGIVFPRQFLTVVASTVVLIVLCMIVAPSSVSYGALSGSLPFAAILAIVGLGQMLVVQQGGFDLSIAGGVSLAVVLSVHYPAGDNSLLVPAMLMAMGCGVVAGVINGLLVGFLRLNAVVATIGVNALLYGMVFAVSGGVPKFTTDLLARVAGGNTFGIANAVYVAIAVLLLVAFVMKKPSLAGDSRRSGPIRWLRRLSGCG